MSIWLKGDQNRAPSVNCCLLLLVVPCQAQKCLADKYRRTEHTQSSPF